jgi:predicted DNA-binding protein
MADVARNILAFWVDTRLETAMTITVDLEPETENRLRTVAGQSGLDPETYVRRLIEQHLPRIEAYRQSRADVLTAEEWKPFTRARVSLNDRSGRT